MGRPPNGIMAVAIKSRSFIRFRCHSRRLSSFRPLRVRLGKVLFFFSLPGFHWDLGRVLGPTSATVIDNRRFFHLVRFPLIGFLGWRDLIENSPPCGFMQLNIFLKITFPSIWISTCILILCYESFSFLKKWNIKIITIKKDILISILVSWTVAAINQ